MNQNGLRIAILLFLLGYGMLIPAIAQTYTVETVPNPKQSVSRHYVSNPDGILSKASVARMDSVLGALEDSTTAQVAVVCLNSIGEVVPKDFATALFRKWGLGYRKKNNGLLILMVKDQRRFEMETGYGLEGILPDAVCNRIQTQQMVPLAKAGNLDQALVAGVEAVAQVISQPEVKQEVFDESKYDQEHQALDTHESLLVLYFLSWLVWIFLRIVGHYFVFASSTRKLVEEAIAREKGRMVRAFFLNVLIPLVLAFMGLFVLPDLGVPIEGLLLFMYAYIAGIKWDSRKRRQQAFSKLFGHLPDPDQYVRRKAALPNGWFSVLLFPIPFWWVKRTEDALRDKLRNHPRQSADGHELRKLTKNSKIDFLTDHQRTEEKLGTVEYDVWYNEDHHIIEAVGYENLSNKTYERCKKCASKALHLTSTRVITKATSESEGRGVHVHTCEACGYQRETTYLIAKVSHSTSSSHSSSGSSSYSGSSSSWSSSSSSSSSGSSWGGGSSGGGGSGSSW